MVWNNENSEGWHRWGWQSSRSDEEIKSIWSDYQDLFTQLLPNLVDSLTNTDYWESSPNMVVVIQSINLQEMLIIGEFGMMLTF